LTWKAGIDESLVYDYAIGLSSTKNSPAPDIVPFKTTKHHEHFRLNNPDLQEGRIFYIVIKTTSKADVIGIQVSKKLVRYEMEENKDERLSTIILRHT